MIVNSEIALVQAKRMLEEAWRESRYLEVEITRKAKQRTLTQNRALHLFCQWLADTLNNGGFDMKKTLRKDADIPWTGASVKEYLWRPVQEAMTGKHSTTEVTTVEPADIHEALCRHLATRLGITCPPWPKREE